jgi:hypothetical protein
MHSLIFGPWHLPTLLKDDKDLRGFCRDCEYYKWRCAILVSQLKPKGWMHHLNQTDSVCILEVRDRRASLTRGHQKNQHYDVAISDDWIPTRLVKLHWKMVSD